MRRYGFLRIVAAVLLAVGPAAAAAGGCSTTIETTPEGTGGGGGHHHHHSSSTVLPVGTGEDAPPDTFPDYVDPGCPDAGPPLTDFECDAYQQDCPFGEACYIYVQYPTQPCGQETYGSICLAAGAGTQGTGCAGPSDCAAGFVCVVSGSGNECVQYCNLTGVSGCPSGYICEPIDVQGFGGCL